MIAEGYNINTYTIGGDPENCNAKLAQIYKLLTHTHTLEVVMRDEVQPSLNQIHNDGHTV